MKAINTADAKDRALDYLVAKCEGAEHIHFDGEFWRVHFGGAGEYLGNLNYSTDWSQGGPIIEREGINLSVDYQDDAMSNDMVQIGWKGNLWNNSVPGTAGFLQWAYGPTPLIAAMRCFVASRLGDTVEVPEELT